MQAETNAGNTGDRRVKSSPPGISTHDSQEPGPSVLLLIGLHGDEAGQAEAPVRALVDAVLLRGTVRVVRCFPEQPDQRCVGPREEDPNRAFPPDDAHMDPFAQRQRLLMQLVEEAEIVIDFHRYHQRSGGPIAFPFDSWGQQLAQRIGITRIVLGLVDTVDGALAMWAHDRGRQALVLEAGPKSSGEDTDHDILIATHALLKALGMANSGPVAAFRGTWPDGPALLRCHGAVGAEGLTRGQQRSLDEEEHLGPLSERVIATLGLSPDARLLMINPDADPVAFACLPEPDITSSSGSPDAAQRPDTGSRQRERARQIPSPRDRSDQDSGDA